MKRMILLFLGGCLLGGGGGVGMAMLRKPEKSLMDHLQSDSTAAAPDSAATHHARADSAGALGPLAVDTLAAAVPADSSHAPHSDTGATTLPRVSAPPAADTAASAEPSPIPTERLAKLFGSMRPNEAARVLENMDDHEVQVLIGQMNDRQATAILSSLPPARAAAISRGIIRGQRSIPR
jgi:hypothetical protein